MSEFTIDKVLSYLPHRYPFLMIDRVLSYDEGKSLTAIKNISVNEPQFTGHFPELPVMPGVLIIEAMAQAAAILAYVSTKTSPKDYLFYLAGLDKIRFKQPVVPGDQVVLKVELGRSRGDFWRVNGEASVNGKIVCSAEIMSARRKVEQ